MASDYKGSIDVYAVGETSEHHYDGRSTEWCVRHLIRQSFRGMVMVFEIQLIKVIARAKPQTVSLDQFEWEQAT